MRLVELVLNALVMATLPRYFFSFLLARLYCLPRYPVLWCKLPAEEFPRCAHSSGSSNDRFLRLPSLDFCPRVRLGLVCEWAFFHPRIGPMCSILHLDPTLPHTHTHKNAIKYSGKEIVQEIKGMT